MFDTYQPSGRFSFLSLPLLLAGVAAAIALAYVYYLALHFIPLIYISFLVTAGMGIALGFAGVTIVKTGKVRNQAVALLIGLLLLLSGLGAKFYFQYQQMIGEAVEMTLQVPDARDQPRELVEQVVRQNLSFMDHIRIRVQTGWNIGRRGGGAPASGVFVWIVWLLEALIIGWLSISGPLEHASVPFSEKTDQWADEEEMVMLLPITDEQMVASIQSAASVDDLLSFPIPQTDESNQFAMYKVNSIEGQEMEDAYLSVDRLTLSVNSKGEQETKTQPLVKHAILSSQNRKRLMENAELLQEAMAEYRQAVDAEQVDRETGELAEDRENRDGTNDPAG